MKKIIFIISAIISLTAVASNFFDLENFSQANQPMPSNGAFKGQFVENEVRRTLIFLTQNEKRFLGINEDDLAFANFRIFNSFYIATIPGMKVTENNVLKNASSLVETVTFIRESWAGNSRPELASIEAHSELEFKFKASSGIVLVYDQNANSYVNLPKVMNALFSIEAVKSSVNRDADFIKNSFGYNFALAHRFYTLKQRLDSANNKEDIIFKKYLLNFSDSASYHPHASAMDYILYRSLLASHQYGRNQTYNLFTNNCTNRLFDIIDVSISYNQSQNKSINMDDIEKNYREWVTNDLENALSFFLEYSKEENIILPDILQSKLIDPSESISEGLLTNIKEKWENNDPKNFLYQFPMFIEGHLRARGLIK